MDESCDKVFLQTEMPTYNPVERNDTQDGLASVRANSKTAVVSKAAGPQKIRKLKGLKGTSKSMKKASIKRSVGKTSVSGAKKVGKTRGKSPIKKKATAGKDKKPRKSPKETGLKKPSTRTSKK
ncbi:hypothetical protein HNY73_015119 [Argiope bruennichi]|uniref:Uncharacterized protein n=1 Tax=Argiope bruennichi TaxID=94029 RepID=A0A8T0ERD4_ARGBR|nr:hypothetical protein HNY73_015119 [Argiope bruennichi]